ncbi:MAG: hypothetical protein RIC19_15960 [Phaeodactylibacter sp.]|uniref:hypothetical protein n=1 Tax=Phaeodactylibacter sp. TaxID=1940289 RepID=UPI0032EB004C
MHRPIFLPFLFSLGLLSFGCAPDKEATQDLNVRLLCESKGESEAGIPQSAVYTLIGEQKVKIANIATCDSIPPGDFSEYGIPDDALAAAGGWYAGAGDYLYAIREGEAIIYYRGWQDEMQEDEGFHYTQLGGYKNGKFELQLPPKREELVGTYTLSQETGSHILFVGMHGDTLIGEHFVLDGILPPLNQLNVLMTGMAPQDSAALDLVDQSFRFSSAMGDGTFQRSGDGLEVSLNLNGQQVRLQKALSKDYSLPE